MPPGETGAAQNADRDRLKFEPGSKRRVHDHQLGTQHHPRNGRSYADQAKHRYGSTIDIDARNSRRCPVSSDGASVAPEGGVLKQDTKNDEHDHHYNERYGQPQNLAVVQQSKLTMPSDHHRLSLANKQRNTAHDAHHSKRHDKSRKPEFADQHSIH